MRLSARSRLALALLWLALLALAGWAISQRLQLSGDLRKFMPAAQTPAQKLLIDELGEGPGSRLLLMSIVGADAPTLAAQSQALRAALAARPQFALVGNGSDAGLDAIPERLRPYRYLLTDSFDAQPLDADTLREALEARVQDLGSPAAALIEPLLSADPTLETFKLAERWQPANAPQPVHGVWFSRDGNQALLIAQTRAAGFDPTGQQVAVDAIRADFAKIAAQTDSELVLTGPGAFSVEIGGRTAREAQWIGIIDGIGLVLLLAFAYRSWKMPILGALPLATAGLAGLGAVMLGFDGVHGITVAFGFTLIGVVQDYPIHLFSHQRPGVSPWANARALWPTLATGVVSTCIAYVTFLFSGVDGLKQLAAFTIAGLGAAALSTRFLLPGLIDPAPRDFAESRVLATLWEKIAATAASARVAGRRCVALSGGGRVRTGRVLAERSVQAHSGAGRRAGARCGAARRAGRAGRALRADRRRPRCGAGAAEVGTPAARAGLIGEKGRIDWLRPRRALSAQRRHAARAPAAPAAAHTNAKHAADRGGGDAVQ